MNKDKSKGLHEKAQAVLKGEIKQLQIIPVAVSRILHLTNNENTTINELANVIETEPTLTVELLRMVNSATYQLPAQVTSVARAINLLGFDEVKKVSIDLLIYAQIVKPDLNAKFDQLYFWQHCLFVAALSRTIATALNLENPDNYYTAGLLHDIGKTILENYGNLSYSEFLEFFEKSDNSITENEKTFFGMSHDQIGYFFCKKSQLPEEITAAIAFHHSGFIGRSMTSGLENLIAIVAFSNFIAWMQGIGSVKCNDHPQLHNDVLETLDIKQLNLEETLNQVDKELQDVESFYSIKFPNLSKLRATLVYSTINLSIYAARKPAEPDQKKTAVLSSLTAPHHSLDQNVFIPNTLKAIHDDFGFSRIIMLEICTTKRSLKTSYSWQVDQLKQPAENLEILINEASEDFLQGIRNRQPILIKNSEWLTHPFVKDHRIKEFFIIPILRHNRFIGILYIDNANSKNALDADDLHQLYSITNELGIAINNAKQLELEKKRSLTDPLTNLNNRRMLNEFLEKLYHEDKARYQNIAVGFIDIDNFKDLNDLCGHQAGDDALKVVSDILKSLTRPTDCIGRYGGEEFIFIQLNNSFEGVQSYAERVRAEVEKRGEILSQRIRCKPLTVSIGVVMHRPDFNSPYDIIDAADKAMYEAKSQGRNRVICKA